MRGRILPDGMVPVDTPYESEVCVSAIDDHDSGMERPTQERENKDVDARCRGTVSGQIIVLDSTAAILTPVHDI